MKRFSQMIFIYFLRVLLLFLGLNGSAGGFLLMIKPDGSILEMQGDWLINSPFKTYLVPGLLLFTFLGALPLLTFTGFLIKINWKSIDFLNIYPDRYWAWTFSIYSGIIAIIWITVQLIMTQYFWIQPVIIFNGLLIIICALVPSVMKRYSAISD